MQQQKWYLSDLGSLRITSALDLVRSPLSEANAKETQHIVVSSLHINMSLDEGLPLLDQRP